jgi:predicted MPP superfamily phosphohydrolase
MVDTLYKYLHTPNWQRQQQWRRRVWLTMANMGLTGWHTMPLDPRWVEVHRRGMPLKNLDPALNGLTMVQISDLHYSPAVRRRYLEQFVDLINRLEPDLVVVTGDLISGGYRWATRVAPLLKRLTPKRLPAICTLGNHDYSLLGKLNLRGGEALADRLAESLQHHGLIVLRNQTLYVSADAHHVHASSNGHAPANAHGQPSVGPTTASKPLAIVGLDDEWSGHLDARKGFDGVDPSLPIVCLNHNPANVRELMAYPWQWMLSGHTHGRAVGSSGLGRRFMKKKFRHFTHGYYQLDGRHLYVNRGLSYGQRMQHWCRPEITLFTLQGV